MRTSALSLKDKFEQLLEATTAFFTDQQGNIARDREAVEQMRQMALALAAEVEKPRTFERFLAFLLGTTTIDALYPLHAIQFMCVVMNTLRQADLKETQRDEIAIAAFFADFGCRGAWLSYQNAHAGAAVFHLRELASHWWTPAVERMILFHHDPKMDASPHHIFSIAAQFQALTRGTGIDVAGQDLFSPQQAIEKIMEEHLLDSEGRKLLLNSFSVYPLGSWVRLSTGETGLVIASHIGNPLRPIIGIYTPGQSYGMRRTEATCSELDLKKHMTAFIAGDIQPSSEQANLFLSPQLWIHHWNRVAAEDEPALEETPEEVLPEEAEIPSSAPQPQEPSSLQVKGIVFESSQPQAETASPPQEAAGISNFIETAPAAAPKIIPTPARAITPVAVPTPVPIPEPVKKPEVDPAELVQIGPELLVDMTRTLEKLEVPLHQISHRCQNETASLPKEFKKFRQAIQEVRSYCHTLASFGDSEIGMVTGVLSLWEGELGAAEQQAHDARAYMSIFLLPWEQKKREVQALLQELREAKPTQHWADIRSEWQDSLKPGLEMLAHSLTKTWDQKQQTLISARNSMRAKVEVAERTKALLLEKLSMMYFSRGIKLRKEKAWEEAIAAFQKALTINPQLWEANTYIGLCHLDAFNQADFKRKFPPQQRL